MTTPPWEQESEKRCDAVPETDDHRISVMVVVRWDIEYSALSSMAAAAPNLLCWRPEEAHPPLKTFPVVVIMDPKADWVGDQVVRWHRVGPVVVVVDTAEDTVAATLRDSGAAVVLNYRDATQTRIIAAIEGVAGMLPDRGNDPRNHSHP